MVSYNLSGLPLHDAASKEYAERVGVYAKAHADRVKANAKEYTNRSSELLGRRFNHLPLAFLKDNGDFIQHINSLMGPHRLMTQRQQPRYS